MSASSLHVLADASVLPPRVLNALDRFRGAAARPGDVLRRWLKKKSPATVEAYRRDLGAFSVFLDVDSIDEAAQVLFAMDGAALNALGIDYIDAMQVEQLAPATISRRISAVRSLLKIGRTLGATTATLEIDLPAIEPVRETAGPELDVVRTMLAHLHDRPDSPKARRDLAVFRLMIDCGLRRNEITTLDVGHVSLRGSRVHVLRKGKTVRAWRPLADETRRAVHAWLKVHPKRRDKSTPLFPSLANRTRGRRLAGSSLWEIIAGIGEAVGVDVWPHGLRHSSCTIALNLTNGNVRDVQHHTGHKSVAVLLDHYDDMQGDTAARDLVQRVAAAVG